MGPDEGKGEGGEMYSETKLPEAIKGVHEKLHSAIVEATRLGGGVGNAARSVNKVLLVHFMKEEELVLPLFRTLPSASRGHGPLGRFETYMLVERMKSELPELRSEHLTIMDAIDRFHDAAEEEGVGGYGQLRKSFGIHARTEEDVYFPAAICIGECLCSGLAVPEVSIRESHAEDREWNMVTLGLAASRSRSIGI
jgi:hypothetical protein